MKLKKKVIILFYCLIFLFLLSCKKESFHYISNNIQISYQDYPKYPGIEIVETQWKRTKIPINIKGTEDAKPKTIWLKIDFAMPSYLKNKDLGLYLGKINSIDEVYFNQILVGKSGQLYPYYLSAWNEDRYYRISKRLIKEKNTITLRITSKSAIKVKDCFFLTSYADGKNYAFLNQFFSKYLQIATGLFSLIFSFILFSFYFQTKDYSYVYLSIASILWAIISIYYYFPDLGLSYLVQEKIFYSVIFVISFFIFLLFENLVKTQNKTIKLLFSLTCVLGFLSGITAGSEKHLTNTWRKEALIIFYFSNHIIMGYYVVKAFLKKNKEGKILFVSYLIYTFSFFYDIFINLNIIQSSTYFFPLGFFILITSFGPVVAMRLMDLADELTLTTATLEQKVDERTLELQTALSKLQDSNDQLNQTKNALWAEIQLATKLQELLVPHNPTLNQYEIACYLLPAKEMGGDYYDVIDEAGMKWLIIGDVSGHGVSAGLIMMMTQTAIHALVKQNPKIKPSTLINLVNTTITENIEKLKERRHMTLSVLAVETDGKFTLSGLHQDIFIYRNKTKSVEKIHTKGKWIGIWNDISDKIKNSQIELNIGDSLLLHTDGLTESWKKGAVKGSRTSKDLYGLSKLEELFLENGGLSPNVIKEKIIDSLTDYDLDDDITFVILKRKK